MKKQKFSKAQLVVAALVIALIVVLGVKIPKFLSLENILNVIRQTSIVSLDRKSVV